MFGGTGSTAVNFEKCSNHSSSPLSASTPTLLSMSMFWVCRCWRVFLQLNLIAKARSHKSYKSQVDLHSQGIRYTHKQNLEILGILDFLRQLSLLWIRKNGRSKIYRAKEKYHLTFLLSPRENVSPKGLIQSLGQKSRTFLGKPGLSEVNTVRTLGPGKFPLKNTNSPSVKATRLRDNGKLPLLLLD